MSPLAVIGRLFINFLVNFGRLSLFTGMAVKRFVTSPFSPRFTLQQVVGICYYTMVRERSSEEFRNVHHDFAPRTNYLITEPFFA